jgi:signal transduction histidine kinase
MHEKVTFFRNFIHLKAIFFLLFLLPLSQYGQVKEEGILHLIKQSKEKSIPPSKKVAILKKAYNQVLEIKNDSIRIKYLSKLSMATRRTRDSILFRKINNEASELAKQLKDSIVLAETYWDLGAFFRENTVKDSAFYSYSEAQKIYEAQGNLFYSGSMLYNMGLEQADIKDYIGSEATTIRAIERFKPLKKHKSLYKSFNSLAIVANNLGEHELAIGYYKEALFYLEKLDYNISLDRTSVENNIGVVYRDKKDYKEALGYFKEVLTTDSLQLKDPALYAKALNNLTICKLKLNDTTSAYDLIQKSIRIKDSIGDKRSLASSYFTLAEYRLLEGDTINSISNAKRAVALSKESSNNERLLETLAFLAEIDKKNASDFAQQYIKLNDSLQQEERQARNKFARIRFETDEFIAENELLAEQKELLSKEKRMWTGIAVGFFLLGLSVYVIINQRVKNQKLVFQQQQQANNQEIFNLMLAQKQKVDEVKRMEQKRISEELHDGVLGKMLGARMVLTGLNKKSDTDSIKERSEAINALKNVENEVRSISHELSHTAYQKLNNFVSSIESLLSTAKENIDINTIFSYEEDEDWDSLKGDIKINVYRIIQETLQNSIKHSDCENFFINFERNEDFFNLIIRDDGKGFKSNKEKKGIGIRNITSRVSKLNGTWTLDTAPGKGTLISIKIPITNYQSIEESNKGHLESV